MLTPESVSVLVPDLVKAPVPLIMPDSVWAAVEPYWNVPALLIAPAYVPLPRLPAPPIESVPALIVVAPLYVLTPESVQVPDPCFVTVPVVVPIMPAILLPVPVPPSVRPNVAPVGLPPEK